MKGLEKVNMFYGLIATIGVSILGEYWFLFAGLLVCNIVDYLTGWVKSRFYNHNESSVTGAKGVLKKVSYWLVIGLAFYVSFAFVKMGELLNINLNFVIMFGWFTLASYLVNEIRSILENLIEMHVSMPDWLMKGLEITNKLVDAKMNTNDEDEKAAE